MFPTPPISSNWFWSNYSAGMTWMKKHEAAYWKSQAVALAEENEKLLQLIHDENIVCPATRSTSRFSRGKRRRRALRIKNRRKRTESFVGNEPEEEVKLEVSQEMLEFFKVSLEHQKQLKKDKFLREEKATEFVPPQEETDARLSEMKEIYGVDSCKILGMETAMQLSFERYLDLKSPKYWPKEPMDNII